MIKCTCSLIPFKVLLPCVSTCVWRGPKDRFVVDLTDKKVDFMEVVVANQLANKRREIDLRNKGWKR